MRPEIMVIGRLAAIGVLSAAAIGCSGGGGGADAGRSPGPALRSPGSALRSPGSALRSPGSGLRSPGPTPSRPAVSARPEVVPSLSGGTWTQTRTADAGAVMLSVAVTGGGEAWAVGTPGENRRTGTVLRWDGHTWRAAPLPPGLRYPAVVSATSPRNVWIFDNHANAWQWDGRRWSARGRPPGKLPIVLDDAVVTGPADAWVAAAQDHGTAEEPDWRPVLARRSPAGWSVVPRPARQAVRHLGATASGDLWALTEDGDTVSSVEHWNGRRWTAVPPPPWPGGATAEFTDLAVVSEREVWVAGSILPPGDGSATAMLMRWNGDRWNPVSGLPADAVSFNAVASDGHGGVWLGASNYHSENKRILLHFDRRSWTYEKTPRTGNAPEVLDLVKLPGRDTVFAVGGNPSYDEDGEAWIWTRS
ncbi:hypothetical protein AAH991_36070 [Microbispora sp. ZYX-F-249]|uniref:Galactose oxidase n=1 Tax=Microbispora maris TaxID=3144104 RepID=A0ABV0AZ79_9ACTN